MISHSASCVVSHGGGGVNVVLSLLVVCIGLRISAEASSVHPWQQQPQEHDDTSGRTRRETSFDLEAADGTAGTAGTHLRWKRNLPVYNPFLRNVTNNFVYLDGKNKNYNPINTDFPYDADPRDNTVKPPIFWEEKEDAETIRMNQAKIMKQFMDPTADPCVDFYQYACGNWGKMNPIPKDKAKFDTFEVLRESLDSVLRDLLEAEVTQDDSESFVKAKHLYASCNNHDILQKRGKQPLMDLLDQFGGWPILTPEWNPKNFDWTTMMGQLRLFNNDIFLSEWVGPDIKNSSEYIIQIDQQGLGLPTRDYYLLPSNRVYLDAYRNFLVTVVTLLGAPLQNATTQVEEIIQFETELARITPAPDRRHNVSELYKRMSVAELQYRVPKINWDRYLSIILGHSVSPHEPIVNFALHYCEDLVHLLHKTPPRIISNYLLWRFVRHRVNNLDDSFQDAKQKFYFTLLGREETPPRWKTCVAQVNNNMGMTMGSMFVKKYFDENSKNDTLIMTEEIKQSFQELLAATDWIDSDTKRLAAQKADVMMLRIGYPDFILDTRELDRRYENVTIHPERYFENILNILQHLTKTEQGHLGTSVNKTQWNTAPAVVNAYYSRNKNQIMIPAGILQPPFYHRHFPRGMKYGGIGVVIGHEITHGFDDKGRQFDKHGNLHRWWKDQAIHHFHERAQCLIEQYSRYVVSEVNMPLDGVNTQGENIADNGAIKQAFRAYKRWLSMNDASKETLPGMNATGMELFFLNFAQIWCGNTRPETSRSNLKTAIHVPGKFRVIGTLQNSVDFSNVYQCPRGSPMNPIKKCSVW